MIGAAFAGFRHGHVYELWRMAKETDNVQILGGWEENESARQEARNRGVYFAWDRYEDLLSDPRVDLVILGDCYARRGHQAIMALEAGRHVLADKPLCTRRRELDRIRSLSLKKGLWVSCMLPLRYAEYALVVKELLDSGTWGQVRCAQFTGQHPLMYATRPGWYFEPGMQGGTITDIAIHGVDLIRSLTGREMERVEFARTWNAFAREEPGFRDCAQLAYRLEGGAGVMGDVSYASPDSFGYALDSYWHFQLWTDGGKIEFGENLKEVRLYKNGETECRRIPVGAGRDNCLTDLLRQMAGEAPRIRHSRETLAAMDTVLRLQERSEEAES